MYSNMYQELEVLLFPRAALVTSVRKCKNELTTTQKCTNTFYAFNSVSSRFQSTLQCSSGSSLIQVTKIKKQCTCGMPLVTKLF
jgi:hypothetical protein